MYFVKFESGLWALKRILRTQPGLIARVMMYFVKSQLNNSFFYNDLINSRGHNIMKDSKIQKLNRHMLTSKV